MNIEKQIDNAINEKINNLVWNQISDQLDIQLMFQVVNGINGRVYNQSGVQLIIDQVIEKYAHE